MDSRHRIPRHFPPHRHEKSLGCFFVAWYLDCTSHDIDTNIIYRSPPRPRKRSRTGDLPPRQSTNLSPRRFFNRWVDIFIVGSPALAPKVL
jgi:hypothetical protein